MFPDSTLPHSTNGGFKNQEEFRNYIMLKQNGKWKSTVLMSATTERKPGYKNKNIVKSFLLQFPYGHSSLPDDRAVRDMSNNMSTRKKHLNQDKISILKHLL